MYEIPLTQGKVALVSRKDYYRLRRHKWCAAKNGNMYYAVRDDWTSGRPCRVIMHRAIMGLVAGDSIYVDHKDGNGLNNQRSNLRRATNAQNQHNQHHNCRNTSGFKGVYRVPASRGRCAHWRARIRVNRKRISLGCFSSTEEAFAAYTDAARKFHGRFARLNFP